MAFSYCWLVLSSFSVTGFVLSFRGHHVGLPYVVSHHFGVTTAVILDTVVRMIRGRELEMLGGRTEIRKKRRHRIVPGGELSEY